MVPYIGDTEDGSADAADIEISIDRGGTFCDVIAEVDGREPLIFKLLSVNPARYADAPTEAIRRVLETIEGREIPVGTKLNASRVSMRPSPMTDRVSVASVRSYRLPSCTELTVAARILPNRHDHRNQCSSRAQGRQVCICDYER